MRLFEVNSLDEPVRKMWALIERTDTNTYEVKVQVWDEELQTWEATTYEGMAGDELGQLIEDLLAR